MNPGVITDTIIIQNLDRYPLSIGGHADVEIAVGVGADHDAHSVSTMTVSVSGGAGISACAIIPVVVVVALQTPVFALQGGMGPVHASIHIGHHHTRASDVQVAPDLIGSYAGDVPFNHPSHLPPRVGGDRGGAREFTPMIGADFLHLGPGGQGEKRFQVAGHGQPVEHPIGGVIRHLVR